jgi:hypothetical protein
MCAGYCSQREAEARAQGVQSRADRGRGAPDKRTQMPPDNNPTISQQKIPQIVYHTFHIAAIAEAHEHEARG